MNQAFDLPPLGFVDGLCAQSRQRLCIRERQRGLWLNLLA